MIENTDIEKIETEYNFLTQPFRWDEQRGEAAIQLAAGYTRQEVAKRVGICERQLYRWLNHPDFASEVDRLTFLSGVVTKAERVRMIKRLITDRLDERGVLDSKKDVFDWVQLLRQEVSSIEFAAIMAQIIRSADDDGRE